MPSPSGVMPVLTRIRRAGLAAAAAAAPVALAWRFAHVYRTRAGFPNQHPPTFDPSALGLAFETVEVPTPDGLALQAWWIPAGDGRGRRRSGRARPAVVLVHGWESGRHRTLPNAQVLHAIGFHVLTVDVRGHGANPAETLPVSAGEFGLDALAGLRYALARPEVTSVALLGHSMGAAGAALAAADEPRLAALVLVSTPAGPYRLTRQTFRLARLPIPDPIAYPLAWLTTRVYLKPRGHEVDAVSATSAVRRYSGPLLAIHGSDDRVVPVTNLERLVTAARTARADFSQAAPVEALVVEGGQHSWLYEFRTYREAVARFLAEALGGPLPPEEAAAIAAGIEARRPDDDERRFGALEALDGAVGSPQTSVPTLVPTSVPAPAQAPVGPPPAASAEA